jgi:hypothetical protein
MAKKKKKKNKDLAALFREREVEALRQKYARENPDTPFARRLREAENRKKVEEAERLSEERKKAAPKATSPKTPSVKKPAAPANAATSRPPALGTINRSLGIGIPKGFKAIGSQALNIPGIPKGTRQVFYNQDTGQYAIGSGAATFDKATFTQIPPSLVSNAIKSKAPEKALPEQAALKDISRIDPYAAGIREAAGTKYLDIAKRPAISAKEQKADLAELAKVDPQAEALRQKLGTYYQQQMGPQADDPTRKALSNLYLQYAQAPGKMTPQEIQEIQQAARGAQAARGNIQGVAPAVQEAMEQGIYGQQLRAQRLAQTQGWLQSGQTAEDVARARAGQAGGWLSSGQTRGQLGQNLASQRQANLANAVNYLGTGQTREGAASRYLQDAYNQAAQASGYTTQYQPSEVGSRYQYLNPAYGQQSAQGAGNWYDMMNAYAPQGGGMSGGQKAMTGALQGAGTGASAGAAIGSVIPGIGTVVGGLAGALIGAGGGAAYGGLS